MQHLLQTASNDAKTERNVYTRSGFACIWIENFADPCSWCSGKYVAYEHPDTNIWIYKACYDRQVRKEMESIRTLPGVLDISGMKRTTVEYGRCKVRDLEGISWWDAERKSGIC